MEILLFDAINERHVCWSLFRALTELGHDVSYTGPIWSGHFFPEYPSDISKIQQPVDMVLESPPEVLFNFRAATLLPEMVKKIKDAGVFTIVWLPDDPVAYNVCARHVVDCYDLVLHCGGEKILEFYDRNHPFAGVNFPFWTDETAIPYKYRPDKAGLDMVFLGNCNGPVKGIKEGRYEILSSQPFATRIFGRVDGDPKGICGGFLDGSKAISDALSGARCAVSIPQFFQDYKDSKYDFPGLSDLGFFEIPSRVVQYAAAGLPVFTMTNQPSISSFPELITFRDSNELTSKARTIIDDIECLKQLSERTHQRFVKDFSAKSRAEFIEFLITTKINLRDLNTQERAFLFRDFRTYEISCQRSEFGHK